MEGSFLGFCGVRKTEELADILPFNKKKLRWILFGYDFQRAEEVIASHNASVPLFLYLPFQSVHGPTQAPERFVVEYKNIRDKIRRTYAGMVSAMDEAVGNVTNAMKKKG